MTSAPFLTGSGGKEFKLMREHKPTVLFLVDRWSAGGILKHISDLCESFSGTGLNCIVAASLDPDVQPPANAEFYDLPLYSENNTKSFPGFWQSVLLLRKLLRSKRVDIIHMHNRYVTLLATLAGRGKDIGRVYTVHSTFHNLRFLPWYPQNIICLNEVGRRSFLRNYFLPQELNIAIVPNGIEIDTGVSNKLLQPQSSTFTFIGRLEKSKGIDLIVRAVAELRDTDIRILIVGSGSEEEALQMLSQNLGLGNRIEFLGYMNDPKVILDKSIALVLPAIGLEGFGYVVIEAFANRRAVIASDLDAFDDTVIDGVTGIRFETGNHLSLAKVLRSAMMRTEQVKVMGEKGFSLACEKFTKQQMVDATLEVYESSTSAGLTLL